MEKLWAGRFQKQLDQTADDFNSSLSFDCKLYEQDIRGSIAHAKMLGKQGIISLQDAEALTAGLEQILTDLQTGALSFDWGCEDIHMFVEKVLTDRLGDVGKKLHTARSRNDQVALDTRLFLRDETKAVIGGIKTLIESLTAQAQENLTTILPGYTHLQRAQPVTFGHHLMAYGWMLRRDIARFQDAAKRMNQSPIGCCALAGTTYDTDRAYEAALLGFDGVIPNSMDGVSDRDFCVELLSAASILMMHLSRLAEEIILWSSWEFQFVELDDSFTTGSSIMPQKKNPDMAELVRGKTGRVYGHLMGTLTMLKGLPLAYNKDMQEDKEALFDTVKTVKDCLSVFAPMIKTMRVRRDVMLHAAQSGFINATDLADYLVKKGMPFRSAYQLVGKLVARCLETGKTLESLPLEQYQACSPLIGEDVYQEISLTACVEKRKSQGGACAQSVQSQIDAMKAYLQTV